MSRSVPRLLALMALAVITTTPPVAPPATDTGQLTTAHPGLAAPSTLGPATADDAVATVSTIGVLTSDVNRCTATVVASDSGSVIATAAHCVYLDGRWNLDNLRFYPGYHDEQAPYGEWQVEAAWVPQAWQQTDGQRGLRGASPLHDFAFVRLQPNADGQTAAAVLGAEGIRFNAAPGATVTEFGYPATGRYDGNSLRRCGGVTEPVTFSPGTAWATDCDFTGGASGGPWLTGGPAGSGSGRVAGVLSSVGDHGKNYGMPFNAEAEELYAAADRGSA